jgi:hypothetical protein
MKFVKIADVKWISKDGVAFKTGEFVEETKFD